MLTADFHRAPTRLDRAATIGFFAYIAVAFVVCVFWLGRDDWFTDGDFSLLAGPVASNVNLPIEQHWSAVPVLLYQGLLRVFGLEYTPYLVTVVLLHLATTSLLWTLMRRVNVRGYVASLTAAVLVLFGPGFLSILMPIQITQNLSLVFALSQLLLADHSGRIGWRDGVALLAGAAGLASSGLMPVLVAATGLALLIRRGWRVAALQTAPLAALFLWWYWEYEPTAASVYPLGSSDIGEQFAFVRDGLMGTVSSVGGWTVIGALLVVVLAVGVAICFADEGWRVAGFRLAAPLSLALGSVVYLAVVGRQRAAIPAYAEFSHHIYTVVALFLPLLACAIDALVARWRWLSPAIAALLLVGVFGNLRFDDGSRPYFMRAGWLADTREQLLERAHSPTLEVDAAARPSEPVFTNRPQVLDFVNLEWLAEQRATGRIPAG